MSMKHLLAASFACLAGLCAMAQAPAPAAPAPVTEAPAISSIVELVKQRRELLKANDAAVEDTTNESNTRLHGSYIHVTKGYMTTDEIAAANGIPAEDYKAHNYDANGKLLFPDLVGKQIDLPTVTGVIHSHQVGDAAMMAQRIVSMWDNTGLKGFTAKEEPHVSAEKPAALPTGHAKTALPFGLSQLIMMIVCLFLIYLAIVKGFEPLLLLPIG
ncbi:MAG: hypothetical protein ACI4W7_06185, partial [Candidatus Spyradenecus sp.]